jgi:ribosomal protein S18 acetylase RimI-like enzyme
LGNQSILNLLPGYAIEQGSTVDQALLVKFMERTYQEQFPNQNFSHLTRTVEQYFSRDTPLWWVYDEQETKNQHQSPIGCLWVGNAIDQVSGDRHPHIFLLYVMPEYRHRGIGKALMNYIENWAKQM